MPDPYVFISYSSISERAFVGRLAAFLRSAGVRVWREKPFPGGSWRPELEEVLLNASIILYVVSESSTSSELMHDVLRYALDKQKPVIPVKIDNEGERHLPAELRAYPAADFRGDFNAAFQRLIEGFSHPPQQPESIKRPERKSKKYFFVSYAVEDGQFVKELKSFLKKCSSDYWDFRESARNYKLDYSIELEEVIQNAAATLSVISPDWKNSDDARKELYFSKDVGKLVLLLKIGDPGPTFAHSGMTYIDFTQGLDEGFGKLESELKRNKLI
jgi:hypothetical protein